MDETTQAQPEGTFARLVSHKPSQNDSVHQPKDHVNTNDETGERTNGQTKKRPDDRALAEGVYMIELATNREKTRQSFDVFNDQKIALDKLQLAIADHTRTKPKLGEMIQEAIDNYIAKKVKELPNVVSDKRSKKRINDPRYG